MAESIRRFSKRIFAVPFGQHEVGTEQEPPANEVLIGRDGRRAYLIDLLMNMGRQGAYLVTGRRGSGKTSFVKHCIAEYQNEVFWRFLRSNAGRTLFWDRIILTLLAVTGILAALVLSKLMEVLILATSSNLTAPPELLLWIAIAPIALLCLYPLLHAKEIFEVVFTAGLDEENRENQRARLLAAGSVLAGAGAAWTWGPFGAPALGLSRLFVALSGMLLVVQALSYRPGSSGEESKIYQTTRWAASGLLALLGLRYLAMGPGGFGTEVPEPDGEFWGNLGLSLLFLGTAGYLRGIHQLYLIKNRELAKIIVLGGIWYILFGSGSLILGLWWTAQSFGDKAFLIWAMFAGALILVSFAVFVVLQKREVILHFRPWPLHALAAKAAVSIVIGLQLAHPFLSLWKLPPLRAAAPVRLEHPDNILRNAIPLKHLPSLANIRSHLADADHVSVFHGRAQEGCWILALLLLFLLLYYLEYEWVVRPSGHRRVDPSLDPGGPAPWEDRSSEHESQGHGRMLVSITFPWMLFKAWLPVLVLSVNLGFDRLDHRRVVHAMLAALRDEYHRMFLAARSGLANLTRALGLFLTLVMTTLLGNYWFSLPESHFLSQEMTREIHVRAQASGDVCDLLRSWPSGPGVTNLICRMPGGDTSVQILYHDLLAIRPIPYMEYSPDHLLMDVVPYRLGRYPPTGQKVLLEQGIHFRVYHLLLFVSLFVIGRWLIHRLPLLPYPESLRRIDAVLDSLSSRTSITSKKTLWKPAQWLHGYFSDEKQTQQDPVDPRTVEFAFLKILRDIQASPIRLPGAQNQVITLPTPEITFVFDELDKLGTRLGPKDALIGDAQQGIETLDAERRRSVELHKLLADMKNVLSSAPARFIFIGGRHLHDEWLADETARHPLLTSIFNAEVYIPSLLTDHNTPELDYRVREYIEHQYRRAQILYSRWAKSRWLPSFGLPNRDITQESFARPSSVSANESLFGSRARDKQLRVLDCYRASTDGECQGELIRDFYHFLTYRSMGNPKKLKELLAHFIRPVGRIVEETEARWKPGFDCRHILKFGDVERFRVQLLSDVYRHLALSFEGRLVRRDDQLAVSVFYLADFLFKFHRRAFSWSNLERVDELVHIHRAPDLREILEEIVERWSERFLHPIRNGMYAFRFRSDIAREVEYLSRQSEHEMAAFNFTLDESLALKSFYEMTIKRLEPTAKEELRDLVAGLGELHEFDQEYETARFHYWRAIHSLDDELSQVLGKSEKDKPLMGEILGSEKSGPESARLFMTWGIARLRLMLQVGMTFEHARNLERASVEYRNARTLARSLILAMLGIDGPWENVPLEARKPSELPPELPLRNRIHMLKNLNLLFQPVFAEAWVAEKLTGAVDTSVSLAEKELWRLRWLLPFVRETRLRPSKDPTEVLGSNFALIIAELHNKVGDLYFFKGRQLVSGRELAQFETARTQKTNRTGAEGYLLRAHYHYAMGLHEVRRFVTHRKLSSRYKLNIWSKDAFPATELWETITREGWPDYVFRSIGGTLNDLAETMLGRVSLFGLMGGVGDLETDLKAEDSNPKQLKDTMVADFSGWMEGEPSDSELNAIIGGVALPLGKMTSWLGTWQEDLGKAERQLLRFSDSSYHTDAARLLMSLNFTLVGAKYLERGGYLEDAASELLEVCETVTHYLWWNLSLHRLWTWRKEEQKEVTLQPSVSVEDDSPMSPFDLAARAAGTKCFRHPYWRYLIRLAVYALRKADQLFRRSRRNELVKEAENYLVGYKIPPAALTLACSLGLVSAEIFQDGTEIGDLEDMAGLILRWTGKKAGGNHPQAASELRALLEKSLVRHSYPMINRLQSLKVLIDSEILSIDSWPEREGKVFQWTSELLELKELFGAPMHFTPLQSGITCALLDLRCRGEVERGWEEAQPAIQRAQDLRQIRRAAQRDLNNSEEMYTLRRSYYEGISDLYYLFDDFNDRQIHFNMAMQMAGTEMASLLKGLLHLPESLAFRQPRGVTAVCPVPEAPLEHKIVP